MRLSSSRAWTAVLEEASPLAVLAVYAFVVVAASRAQLVPDSWLALLSGREIAHHGLPHRDVWTVYSNGREWTDQQWLGQLALYGLYAAGGFRLLFFVHTLVVVASFGLALLAARRLGASSRTVALVAPLSMISAPWALQVRTQEFAFLLFVVVLYLLAADSRSPSARVLLVLPLLAVWANVHGSALLGALLCFCASVLALARRRRAQPSVRARSVALVVSPVLLLASPYASGLPGYYRHVLVNPAFSKLVAEWRPSSPSYLTAAFYVLAAVTIWFVARNVRRLTAFERLALALTLAAGIAAIRSIPWFAFAALVLLPVALEGERWTITLPRRARPAVALAAGCLLLGSIAFVVSRSGSWFTHDWPRGAVAAATRAAGGDRRVFADDLLADWLLFEAPSLRGRIAFDVRFELLSDSRLHELANFDQRKGDAWRTAAADYPVVVISIARRRALWRALDDPPARVAFEDGRVGVLVRS